MTGDNLPPSLAATPNIPVRDQTDEQLEAERVYWADRLRLDGPSAAVAAHEFLRDCEREQRRRRRKT